MLTAQQRQNIAAANVIASIVSAKRPPVQLAAISRLRDSASATRNVGAVIGIGAKASGTKGGVLGIGSGSSHSSRTLAANAFTAAMPIRASLISTTSTLARKTNRPIAVTQLQCASVYGRRKWIISNSSARTAIGLRPTQRRGELRTFLADIACRRIEEATLQKDLFIEPAPKPVQPDMLTEAAE